MDTHTKDNISTIRLPAKFNFECQAEFRNTYEQLPKSNRFILDFSKTDYIDSAALGMLLLLKDFAGGEKADIHITRCNPDVKNIFQISNFDRLFKIS